MVTPLDLQILLSASQPNYEREIAVGIFMGLYLTTQVSSLVLPRLFPRINSITPGRQRQVFTLWPMIFLKVTVALLCLEAEYATRFRANGPYTPKSIELLNHQSNIIYILVLGYMFELLHRPNPIELDFHHVFVFIAYFYYRLRSSKFQSSGSANSASIIDLFHLTIVMVIYGVGPVDLASETMRFVYYAIDPSVQSIHVMNACVGVAWLGRIVQWIVMLGHLSGTMKSILETWGFLEMTICAAFLAYWIWMETVELFFLIGLAKRHAGRNKTIEILEKGGV